MMGVIVKDVFPGAAVPVREAPAADPWAPGPVAVTGATSTWPP